MSRPTRPIEDIYPLSSLQSGLLAASLDPRNGGAWFQQTTCALTGPLDATAWRRAWERLVERHSILRTAFVWERRDEPFQIVFRQVRLPWQEEDWRGVDSEARLREHLEADLARGFNLAKAPLMRFGLFRTADDEHRFVWSYHHLLIDGWSLAILLQEVLALYESLQQGREPVLGRPRPFRDYIEWLRSREADEPFWRRALAGFTAPTPLPAERETPGVAGYAFEQRHLSEETTGALQRFARSHELTLNTVLQGAWGLLLARHAGERDVVFGATVSGRPPGLPGVESMVGPFINTLPVRVRLDGLDGITPGEPVASWLGRLQQEQIEMRDLEHTPLARVQRWSDLPAGAPLFESLLVFQNFPRSTGAGPAGLEIRNMDTRERATSPLALRVNPGSRLSLEIGHDLQRFTPATVRRLLEQLETLLEGIAARPSSPVSDLPLLTEDERRRMAGWNETAADFPAGACIHDLFHAQARRTPDLVAVLFEDESLTYTELDARTTQLARHLRTLGVGPEVTVGLFLDRSVEMIVGMLGVLKAGGAYLPLDPALPQERLSRLIDEARPPVLLTHSSLLFDLPVCAAWTVCLDAEWPAVAIQSPEPLGATADPDNLAYILYTSGSTGAPKGVLIRHRGIANLATTEIRMFGVKPGDRVLQFASLGFDASVWEIFKALLAGATICLAPRGSLLPGPDMARLLRDLGITHATLPPSVLAALPALPDTDFPDLRVLVAAGEACTSDLVDRWAPGRRFFNAYGPSETTVCATAAICHAGGGKPDIGHPISNMGVHVLGPDLRPMPVGAAGELCIAGVGLARGYHERPDLTADRFIPDREGNRLYRTGDLACWRPDGSLEFLGRIDEQVKLRGFRIEPGEIQAALALHPGVRDSIVIVREDNPGDRRLVAYVVPREDAGPLGDAHQAALGHDLREHLRRTLPEYMVPSAFVTLSSLPLNTNGKVDRQALPVPAVRAVRDDLVLPRTPAEERLAAIWRSVLHVERIGIHDSFFDLGGDSILAVQVVSRANQAGFQLSPGQVFQLPTIAQIAEIVGDSSGETASPLLPLRAEGTRRPLFLVHTGTGSALPYRYLARHLDPDRPVYGLQLPDLYEELEGYGSIEAIAARYLDTLREVQPQGPYLLAGHSGGALVAYEMSLQLQARNEEVALLAILDNPAPAECRAEAGGGSDSIVVSMVNLLKRFYGDPLRITEDDLRPLDPEAQLELLLERLRLCDLAPADAGLEWVRGFVRVQELLGQAVKKYSEQAAYAARPESQPTSIVLFRTRELVAKYGGGDFGWGACTSLPVRVIDIPGDHVTMLTEPDVLTLAALLHACLEEADGGPTPWLVTETTGDRSPELIEKGLS